MPTLIGFILEVSQANAANARACSQKRLPILNCNFVGNWQI